MLNDHQTPLTGNAFVDYSYDKGPATEIAPNAQDALSAIKSLPYAVLVGRNNCGKSFILKNLARSLGPDASYLGPARYHNFNLLTMEDLNKNKNTTYQNLVIQLNNPQQNLDATPLNLPQMIANLSNVQRDRLREIMAEILGVDLAFRRVRPENDYSQAYISCDGHNLSYTSSGFRLIVCIIAHLLNDEHSIQLIDEPELGVSPEAQNRLADFLLDEGMRKRFFPHLNQLIIATHSSIFLDRRSIRNNFGITRDGVEISIQQVNSQADFHEMYFSLLGNRFETLFLPSIVIFVEGICDKMFIERVLSLRFPSIIASVLNAYGDGRIGERVNAATSFLGDIQKSPYRGRMIVVMDSRNSMTKSNGVQKSGISSENIIVWSQNGIEYFYPPSQMSAIFGTTDIASIVIDADDVSFGDVRYRKVELCEKIIKEIRPEVSLNQEFEEKFMRRVSQILQ